LTFENIRRSTLSRGESARAKQSMPSARLFTSKNLIRDTCWPRFIAKVTQCSRAREHLKFGWSLISMRIEGEIEESIYRRLDRHPSLCPSTHKASTNEFISLIAASSSIKLILHRQRRFGSFACSESILKACSGLRCRNAAQHEPCAAGLRLAKHSCAPRHFLDHR
jgi:hypothetical protein